MTADRRIPLADLKAQYRDLKDEIDAAIRGVIDSTAFVRGRAVTDFEEAFAAYCGARACVGTANGTDAIGLALRALGIGPGDEVITVSHTFVGTVEGIVMAGAVPVFVDVDDATLLIDPDLIEAAVTPRTRAVMPVHLYGQPCDMDRIAEVAGQHGLRVVDDAAQAHGAKWRGRTVGAGSDAACFSFFPGKNLGAYGDGGAVTADDPALTERIRGIANHGRKDRYLHDVIGVNSRLDGLQAAVLGVKLRHLDGWNARRRAHAALYDQAFAGTAVRPLAVGDGADPVFHLYVVRVPEEARDGAVAALNERAIDAAVHYPVPLHLQPALAGVETAPLPVTEQAAKEVISLPVHPEMTSGDVGRVAGALRKALGAG